MPHFFQFPEACLSKASLLAPNSSQGVPCESCKDVSHEKYLTPQTPNNVLLTLALHVQETTIFHLSLKSNLLGTQKKKKEKRKFKISMHFSYIKYLHEI